MPLQNDDLFLVNRGGTSFKTEYGILKENINEDQGVTVSEDPPADPHEGDLWYNSEDGRLYVWYVTETTGVVTGVGIRNAGSGYTADATNVETAGGNGFGLTVDIDAGVGGNFANPSVNQGGHGYQVGDYIIITGAGHQNGTLNVTTINSDSAGQWVDASPDGTAGADLWTRTGTTLEPATAGDNVDLGTGDLTAAAGTFSGITRIGDFDAAAPVAGDTGVWITPNGAVQANKTTPGGSLWAGNQNAVTTSLIRADGTTYIGGDIGGADPNITLGSDGFADFCGGSFSISSSADYGARLQSSRNRLLCQSGTGGMYLTFNGTSWTSNSDSRLKKNLVKIDGGLDKVSQLNGYTGHYKTDQDDAKKRSFLVAQEVQQVLPEAVDSSNPEELGVSYTDLIPLLVSALHDAKDRIEALEAKVQQLEGGN